MWGRERERNWQFSAQFLHWHKKCGFIMLRVYMAVCSWFWLVVWHRKVFFPAPVKNSCCFLNWARQNKKKYCTVSKCLSAHLLIFLLAFVYTVCPFTCCPLHCLSLYLLPPTLFVPLWIAAPTSPLPPLYIIFHGVPLYIIFHGVSHLSSVLTGRKTPTYLLTHCQFHDCGTEYLTPFL